VRKPPHRQSTNGRFRRPNGPTIFQPGATSRVGPAGIGEACRAAISGAPSHGDGVKTYRGPSGRMRFTQRRPGATLSAEAPRRRSPRLQYARPVGPPEWALPASSPEGDALKYTFQVAVSGGKSAGKCQCRRVGGRTADSGGKSGSRRIATAHCNMNVAAPLLRDRQTAKGSSRRSPVRSATWSGRIDRLAMAGRGPICVLR